MSNVLLAPSLGKITFDSLTAGVSTQSALTASSQISYDGLGGINITSYNTSGTERLSVDGVNGRLFTVSDVSSGSIFSINDISGLPIIDVNSGTTDVIKIGTYGTNALVVNDIKVGIGTATPSQALQVVGNQTTSGTGIFGVGKIGTSTPYAGWARFGHSSWDLGGGYGFMQNGSGGINVDAAASTTIQLLVNNTAIVTVGSSLVTVAQPLSTTSGRLKNIQVKTANYTLVSTDHIIVGNSASTFTLTLPAASSNTSREFIIKNKNTGIVTVDATALGQIDGQNTTTVAAYSAITLISDGTTWNAF